MGAGHSQEATFDRAYHERLVNEGEEDPDEVTEDGVPAHPADAYTAEQFGGVKVRTYAMERTGKLMKRASP